MCRKFHIFLFLFSAVMSLTSAHPKNGQDDDGSGEETTKMSIDDPNDPGEFTYLIRDYIIKTSGVQDLTFHISEEDGELVLRSVIGLEGTIRINSSPSQVLWEIRYDTQKKNKWIRIKPPKELDVGLVHWERDGDTIFISGPLKSKMMENSEETTPKRDL